MGTLKVRNVAELGKRWAAALLLCAVVGSAAPADAAGLNWSLGASLGFESFMPSESGADDVNTFGWPLFGLRVGFAGDNPKHEVYLLSAISHVSSGGTTLRSWAMTGNYQYNFATGGAIQPYLTAGLGLQGFGFKDSDGDESATSFLFGGGFGVRHKMGNGHGVLRGEVRYDHNSEGTQGNAVLIPEGGTVGVRLGFDLWDK